MGFGRIRRLSRGISFRIAVLFFATYSAGISLAFAVTYLEIVYSLEKADREAISSKLHDSAAILNGGGIELLQKFFSEEVNRAINAPFLVRVLNLNGTVVYFKPSVQKKEFDLESAFRRNEFFPGTRHWHTLRALNSDVEFDLLNERVGKYILQVGQSSETRQRILEKLLSILVLTGTTLVAAGAGLGFWQARKSLAPLRSLTSTIREIEEGDLSKRVPAPNTDDELLELALAFNRMIGRLELLLRAMGEALDNVAHDIRTPLARIRGLTERALISGSEADHRAALEDAAESVSDLSEMVDQVLSVSQAGSGALAIHLRICDVRAVLAGVIEIYEFVALDQNVSIRLQCEGISWPLDESRFKQAVANLLDNAIKFSEDGRTVEIQADSSGDTLRIRVIDHGPGIPDDDIPRIWDRLFRGDRSRSTRGSGLGLPIVRSIIAAHGGTVSYRPNSPHGSIFEILLPARRIKQSLL